MPNTQHLLPISELMNQSDSNTPAPMVPTNSPEVDRIHRIIDSEMKRLIGTHEKNKEEITKRLTEIQTLKENNLVMLGAISAIKKLRSEL